MSNFNFADRIETLEPSTIREMLKAPSGPDSISFSAGNPSPLTFPAGEMAEIAADIFLDDYPTALQYGITEGYEPLRQAVEDRFRSHAIGSEDDRFIITSGAQQVVDLSIKVLVNEGDTVLCESPSFIGALNCFRSYKTRLVGIPMDKDGMDIDALESALKNEPNVRIIYTIPTFHNPCGSTMTLDRRRRLIGLAEKYNVFIIEDNPYYELRYSGEDLPTLKSMDEKGIVIYAGSFSKVIAPGIRIGFASAHRDIMARMTIAKQVSDVHTNQFFQILVERYLRSGLMDDHVSACCALYKQKRDRMLFAMEKHMSGKASWNTPDGGLFIWGELPEGYDGQILCSMLKERQISCVPGNTFSVDKKLLSRGFRLNFTLPTDEQIDRGIAILGEVLSEYVK